MNTAPYCGVQLLEKFDVILTAAAFDQNISLLFIDDGIFQIKQCQQVKQNKIKNTLELFNVLEVYDVNSFYIEKESLEERGIKLTDLGLSVIEHTRTDINKLIQQFDLVL